MTKSSVFRKSYHINFNDVDFRKKLRMSTLFNFLVDCAGDASIDLGRGIETLEKEYGVAWILIKMKVEVLRIPSVNEDIVIESWPQEPKSLEFERDFLVFDSSGNIIIRALSSWVIMDIVKRKIMRSQVININYPNIRLERAIDAKMGKINTFGELTEAYKKVVGYSDIDFNGHLNNSKYVDFSMDCFTVENHKQYSVKSIEIHFIDEALPQDTLVLYKDISKLNAQNIYIEGRNENSNKIAFKALVEIEQHLETNQS